MSQPRPTTPTAARALTAAVLALVLALLAGCGLRLETPPPAPLTPDVEEQARQRAAADAAELGILAGPVPDPAPDPAADPVGAARAAVATEARAHLDLLGGLYDPGTPADDPDADPAPTATPTPEPSLAPATVDALLARLTEASATARADAALVSDGALARLLGSVSAGRLLSAARLAGAAGLPPPGTPAVTPPDAAPAGMSPADLSTVVVAEDSVGYAYEVIAAKAGGDLRARAGERAAVHRSRAQAWAEAGGLDGTGQDPRRVAYAVPGGLEDPAAAAALARSLETTLAAGYASAVATVVPDARPAMLDAMAEATAQAVAWGAPLPALPGLPERAGG